MNKAFWRLGCLALAGITATLVSIKIVQAQPSSLTVKDTNGKEVIVYQESHALVIWAGDYKNWSKLNNVQNEAKEVVAALQKQGFQVNIIANPNGNQLSDGIKNFIDDYGYLPNNRLVIFFSGHGHTRQQTKGYLVPVDAPDPIVDEQGFLKAALSMEQINSWAIQMEAKHVLFVFDSCFSGTIFKQRSNGEDGRDAYIRDVMNKPVRQFLTAGDADEKVPAKSVFTPLFIRGLEGAADYTKDGYVTGTELGIYLRQYLSEYTKEQHPQFGTILDPNLDEGDIVFRYPRVSTPPDPSPNPPSPNPPSPTVLISKVTHVDYKPLLALLKQGKWQEADDKTLDLMLTASKRENQGYLDPQSLEKFACEDLQIIDQLWRAYSNGKFGFSAQQNMWEKIGGNANAPEKIWRRFAIEVGWKKGSEDNSEGYLSYEELNFKTDAPQGHLPVLGQGSSLVIIGGGKDIFSRMNKCQKVKS